MLGNFLFPIDSIDYMDNTCCIYIDVNCMFCLLIFTICSLSNYSHFPLSCRRLTLILCDSRGSSILPYLNDPDIVCKVYRGARISDVALRASKLIRDINPRVCLILAGINDFTIRDRESRVTRIRN